MNPFTPGYGIMPPYMAGREREQAAISESLALLANSRGPRPIMMIGPRGCGKTVLIEWCQEQARRSAGKVRIKELIGNIPSDLGEIASSLADGAGTGFRPSEASAKVNVGIASADVRFRAGAEAKAGIVDTLVEQCEKSPLLLVVDEAARKSPQGMGELLELVQVINRRSNSLLLVIAGTPATMEVLRASGATFFDRAKGLNIGLLEESESKEAIRKPLSGRGMSIADKALDEIVEDSQGFPFFLQEWGKALFDAAHRNSRNEILPDDVVTTRDELRKAKEQTYESRYDEWREADIELLAQVLRGTRENREKGDFTKADLLSAVSRILEEAEGSAENAEEFSQRILDTGCLWKPLGSAHLVSGLPSFIDHVLQRAAGP